MKTYRYGNENANIVLVQLISDYELSFLEQEYAWIRENAEGEDFLLLGAMIGDWNEELSPWEAPAVFGKETFGSGAAKTLAELEQALSGFIRQKKTLYLGGYSLAGLFTLWQAYQKGLFAGIAAVSPSVWFPDFSDYARENAIHVEKIYLSLGDKEHKTRNPIMATVRDRITELYEHYEQTGCDCTLEFNPGNHFTDPWLRMAKGFVHLLADE
jgi:predicted alpha/beta superfamily hydrolase